MNKKALGTTLYKNNSGLTPKTKMNFINQTKLTNGKVRV